MGRQGLVVISLLFTLVLALAYLQASTDTLEGSAAPLSNLAEKLNPLSIAALRNRGYEGSDLVIKETLPPGANYARYLASYESDGLTVNGLLTVPNGPKPANGWPVIIFNHGYIPPTQYSTTQSYAGYVDYLAQQGFIVFKSDYRGQANSEGKASGAYFSNSYTIDVLNSVASLKKFKDADSSKIGMWGHSMGGQLTLRAMVTSPNIKVGVIWGGVVAPYDYLVYNWRTNSSWRSLPPEAEDMRPSLENFLRLLGAPEVNKVLYDSISPNSHLTNISGPLQLHHGQADDSVPAKFSEILRDEMLTAGKQIELFLYPGADHNISQAFGVAMDRTVAFFNLYLKAGG